MSNIYLKVTTEKNWRFQIFNFQGLSPGQLLGSSNSCRCHWILKLPPEVWEENCKWVCYYFNFEKNYDNLKSKSPCIWQNKNLNFKKTKWNQKWKIPHTPLQRWTLSFSSYKNHKLKVKLWWVWVCTIKKRAFFVPSILSKGNLFKI